MDGDEWIYWACDDVYPIEIEPERCNIVADWVRNIDDNSILSVSFINWENEVRSVAMILTSGGSRLCTGSLINNVRQDLTPYFLTANHCLGGDQSWIFMFNYESPGCTNQNGPTYMTVQGSTRLVNSSTSDVALLLLDETPPLDYEVHYAGWDASGNTPSTPVGIHHPSGDIKKISFDYNNASNAGNYWDVNNWEDGTTEPGSSGSPLFDGNTQLSECNHFKRWAAWKNYNREKNLYFNSRRKRCKCK